MLSFCSHVVVNRNNLLSVFVFRICEWIKEWRRWRSVSVSADTESKDSSRSSDDAVSHPQEHTGRMVDWTLCDSWSQSSSPPLTPLELCLHSASQQQGPVRAALHTSCCCFSLWILRTQLSLRPHTLSSSHSPPLRPPSVERRRHQCYRDSLHQLWVSDAAHPVERAAGTSVLFRGGAASSLLHVHVLEWTR